MRGGETVGGERTWRSSGGIIEIEPPICGGDGDGSHLRKRGVLVVAEGGRSFIIGTKSFTLSF